MEGSHTESSFAKIDNGDGFITVLPFGCLLNGRQCHFDPVAISDTMPFIENVGVPNGTQRKDSNSIASVTINLVEIWDGARTANLNGINKNLIWLQTEAGKRGVLGAAPKPFSYLGFGSDPNKPNMVALSGRRLTMICDADCDFKVGIPEIGPFWSARYIGSQLPLRRLASNQIGMIGKIQGDENEDRARDAEIGPELGSISCLPIRAKLGISAIISGAAFLALFRSGRPFGLLVFSRRDILEAICYGLLGSGLLALSFWVGTLSSSG